MTSIHTMSFYDETLKKQIEGFYKYDGKAVHVSSWKYGARSAPPLFSVLGRFPDHNAVELFAKQVLSELSRDAEQKVLSEKVKVLSGLARDAERDFATSHSLKKAA
jgi:hypothetical protein